MTITAMLPTTILKIKKDRLFALFSDNQAFLISFLSLISDHATILGDRIKHYVNRTIRESITSFLEYERKQQNSNRIKISMSKKALAEKIGVQRTSLSRELAKMRNQGLITFDANSIEIIE
jgi:CRP-like cAMP-binding protein